MLNFTQSISILYMESTLTHWLSGRVWKSLWFYLLNNYFLGAYCPGYLG